MFRALGEADGILIAADRNPNTTGAKLFKLCTTRPGSRLKKIAEGVRNGQYKVLLCFGEDATKAGLSAEDLAKLDAVIAMDILPNTTTRQATVLLPASGWAEKRGSMINLKGRLQRLNQAVTPPAQARDDWEILRDLIQAISGSNGTLRHRRCVQKDERRPFRPWPGLASARSATSACRCLRSMEKTRRARRPRE